MVVGMVSYDMPFFMHTLNEIRTCGYKVADHEECSGRFMLLQGVEDRFRIAVLVTAVEGKVQYFFLRIFRIVSVICF